MTTETANERCSERDLSFLSRCVALAREARARGDHPFGSVVVAADGRAFEGLNTVVSERNVIGHAETAAARLAGESLSRAELAASTLYTSAEPCIMCAGAIHWAGIGRVVSALSEPQLAALVSHQEGAATLNIPSREVFERAGAEVISVGPVDVAGAAEVHAGFWDAPRGAPDPA
ncbi:nucleoside deaminase [Leucobacter sp. M11]|uniref:nucleoside deaminase n=1 Tax=Leucobacter sp. M11 TaxID=2993565 RepID=UPI002D80AFE3|nr:nucleoside deaminase [Leucobacter sp. M11]MEB4615520.1 nucleoside deaminase [Leucobacter sp. M11]